MGLLMAIVAAPACKVVAGDIAKVLAPSALLLLTIKDPDCKDVWVLMVLATLNVFEPAPPRIKLDAVKAAVCVIEPEASRVIVLLVAVSAAAIAMLPP